MKAENLMIGDFVMQNGCTHPSRVAGVTPNKIHTIWADGTKHAKDACYFEPILLTTEILEKNGFVKHDKIHPYYMDYYHERDGFTIFNSGTWHGYILDSVHQLQHALRLCGLNDLADNFKV